jgi:hypothetical protein
MKLTKMIAGPKFKTKQQYKREKLEIGVIQFILFSIIFIVALVIEL